jgi:hypothetical protein
MEIVSGLLMIRIGGMVAIKVRQIVVSRYLIL